MLDGQQIESQRANVTMSRKVLVGGIAILAMVVLSEVYTWRLRDASDAAICKALYADARSLGDTARIDLMPAPRERGHREAAPKLTCGELRTAGRIR